LILHLLQCRPQSSHEEGQSINLPAKVPEEDILFSANYLIPNGIVERVSHIVFIDPRRYAGLSRAAEKLEIARTVGRINRSLQNQRFILMGPGRWGTSNLELGVKVTYADIFNTQMLIEIGLDGDSGAPEVSHGTHFFQDLVESRIFPLALFPQQPDVQFDWGFLEESPNSLPQLIPEDAVWADIVKVIEVPAVRDGRLLEVVMSADQEQALAYFKHYDRGAS
jgi:hypothetical protein